MQITLIATGSRGDVQPYIALGRGLLRAGHGVRLVTHENYQSLVQSYQLDFRPIGADVQAVAQSRAMQERIERGNFLLLMAQMAKEAKRGAVHLAQGALDACRDVDLVMGGMGGMYVGLAVAEKLGLPFIEAHVVPFTPTRSFSSALTSGAPAWLGGTFNRATHHLARQLLWQGFRSADTTARREVLGLPAAPVFGPHATPRGRDLPVLYGFSPSVISPPPDWGANVHVTGYWLLDEAEGWTPPPTLARFLDAGEPPVYIGFGSMSSRNPEQTAALVLDALKRVSRRAVLMSGWGGLRAADLPDTVFMVDAVPHGWLYPRMAAVVHHGGAGTTAAGLRAGVPSLVIPFFGDQPFWGRRVAALGVGLPPIARRRLTAERLAEALARLTTDAAMRERAAALGARIRAEDGAARAAEVVEAAFRR